MKARDISKAEWLRPSVVEEVYSIPPHSALRLHKAGDIKSVKLGAKGGRKGTRLYCRSSIESMFAKRMEAAK